MPTNFPTSVDNFTNPTANDSLNLPSHSTQHANANDAIEAVESYLLTEPMGLRLVKKQTIGSAVSSVTVTNAFSATYENYKIIINGGSGAASSITMALNGSGTNYSYVGIAQQYGSSAVINLVGGPTTSWNDVGRSGSNGLNMNVEIFNPFVTGTTTYRATTADLTLSTGYIITAGGIHNASVSNTGFTIANSGGMTGGTIYVYGYTLG
jgi:hypothetical protein